MSNNERAMAIGVTLSPNAARRFFFQAGNRLLNARELQQVPDLRIHVADYLGSLFDFVDIREGVLDTVVAIPDLAEVAIGEAFFAARHSIVSEHGDPALYGTTGGNAPTPEGYAIAVNAHDAMRLVQQHVISVVYESGLTSGSRS